MGYKNYIMEKEMRYWTIFLLIFIQSACSLKKEKLVTISPDNLVKGIMFRINDYTYVNGYSSSEPIVYPPYANVTNPDEDWKIWVEKNQNDTIFHISAVCYLYMPKNKNNSNVFLTIAVHSFRGSGWYGINTIDQYSTFEEYGSDHQLLNTQGLCYVYDGYVNIKEFDWSTYRAKGNFYLSYKDNEGRSVILKDGYFVKP